MLKYVQTTNSGRFGKYTQLIDIFILIRVNDGVVLAGWGSMTKHGNTTTKLQDTRLIIYPHMACNSSYNLPSTHPKSLEIELVLPNLIQSNLLCAGSGVCIY